MPDRTKHTSWSSWLFVAAAIGLMLHPFVEAPKHLPELWPAHAYFHFGIGLANQFFFGFVAIVIARIPFRRGERWSWFVLAAYAMALISVIPATLYFGSGPAPRPWIFIAVLITAMLVALVATFRVALPDVGDGR